MTGRYRSILSLFVAVTFAVPAGGAMSMPIGQPEISPAQTSAIQEAAWRRVCSRARCHRVWVGPRRHWRSPRIVVRPRVIIRPAPRVVRGNRHVRWCDNRYRSYNRATDQFLGFDGQYHYCNSPYR
jgi:BA14K-like protein